MPKLICLLNNRNPVSPSKCLESLDYHSAWHRSTYNDIELFLGCLHLPFMHHDDFWLVTDEYVLVIDGEVHPWPEPFQKQSQTSWLLQSFLRYRQDLVHHVQGSFTILIWNRTAKVLFVLNDRMGLRPLYFARYSGKLCLASEVKAILADPDFSPKINETGVIDLFSYEHVLGNDTLVRGVEVFPNASIARIDLASMDPKPRRYWDFEFASDIDQSTAELNNEHLDDFKDRLKEAVRRSMDGSNRVGLLLSGGLDSRTIAGAIGELKESGGSSIESFTFGEPHSDDVRFARKISKAIKSNHHYTGVKKERMPEFFQKAVFYQDGMASCKHCHYFHMLDELEQAVEVGLDGFAGDVLPRQMFRSFLSGGVERALSAFQTINATTQREILDPSLEPEIRRSKDRFLYLWQDSFERCSQNPLDHFNLTQRQRKFINYGKISKRNHIEIRTPFTDYDLMDFSLRIPRRFKIKDLITKETLFKFYPRLARIPQAEVGYLRAGNLRTLVYGKVDDWKTRWKWKTSLMDYAGYFRTTLKEFLTGIILTPEFRSRGYFQYSRVQEMLEDHFQRRANHETTIGVLLTFELWCRIFIDRTMDIPTLISKC